MTYIPQSHTISTAPQQLNTNDRAMWCVGWNECRDAMLANPASIEINLGNAWRARLLDGRTLERDAQGYALHPDLPMLEEDCDYRQFFASIGLELGHTCAEDQLSSEALDAMSEAKDGPNFTDWTPAPPKGEGWVLVSIHDTEDGTIAWWLRPMPQPIVIEERAANLHNTPLHSAFEKLASDSHEFKRGRHGGYRNPPVARDFKWFKLGFEHAQSVSTPNVRPAALIDWDELPEDARERSMFDRNLKLHGNDPRPPPHRHRLRTHRLPEAQRHL